MCLLYTFDHYQYPCLSYLLEIHINSYTWEEGAKYQMWGFLSRPIRLPGEKTFLKGKPPPRFEQKIDATPSITATTAVKNCKKLI